MQEETLLGRNEKKILQGGGEPVGYSTWFSSTIQIKELLFDNHQK
jgi:hypothetical protein